MKLSKLIQNKDIIINLIKKQHVFIDDVIKSKNKGLLFINNIISAGVMAFIFYVAASAGLDNIMLCSIFIMLGIVGTTILCSMKFSIIGEIITNYIILKSSDTNEQHFIRKKIMNKLFYINSKMNKTIQEFELNLSNEEMELYKEIDELSQDIKFSSFEIIIYNSLLKYLTTEDKVTLIKEKEKIFELIDSIEDETSQETLINRFVETTNKEEIKYKNEKLNKLDKQIKSSNTKSNKIKQI